MSTPLRALDSSLPAAPENAAVPSIVAVGPNMGHALLLLLLAAALISGGQMLALVVAQQFHVEGHQFAARVRRHAARRCPLAYPGPGVQLPARVSGRGAACFARCGTVASPRALHWNLEQATRYGGRLILLGLCCGFGIGLFGSVLPMPKDPPIMADMMHSPSGAWMMFLFGITGAPLFEEMLFRGFLLPGFVNAFRWLSQRGDLSPAAVSWVGIPFSILFTSLPFALMHGQQVSHAWAPVFLIGLVSIVLCIVRLRLNSLASSTLVHAAYNFTLFAGLLVQTGGFRHLERLAQ